MSVLEIKDLHVSIETDQGAKNILKGVDLSINEGETHAIMGPNGSGKSTLAYTIAGHPKYHVEGGSITIDGVELLDSPSTPAPGPAFPGHAVPGRDPRRVVSATSCAPPRPPSTARPRRSAAGSRTCASR